MNLNLDEVLVEQDLEEILRERNGELRKELKDEEKYGELRKLL